MSHYPAAKMDKKICFSPASSVSISLYICFTIQIFIKKLIIGWCWSGVLPPPCLRPPCCTGRVVSLSISSVFSQLPGRRQRAAAQVCQAGAGGMPAGLCQPPGAASAIPASAAAAAAVHLDET